MVTADLDSITGTRTPVELFVNKQFIEILPNGTISGNADGSTNYTLIIRESFNKALIILQNPLTCMYVCMDRCGFSYGAKVFSKDCLFTEIMEENNYNTYSRVYNRKRSFLALDNHGHPRRTQLRIGRPLLRMTPYVLTLLKRPTNASSAICRKQTLPTRHRKCNIFYY